MIPSTLRLALPLSQPVRYIELSDRKNWGTKGSTENGAIYRLAHAANTIGANPNDRPGYLISFRPGLFAFGTQKSCVRDTEVASATATKFPHFFGQRRTLKM